MRIDLNDEQLPKNCKIFKVELSVSGGELNEISNLPEGWSFNVTNDTNPTSHLEAEAQAVGAAMTEAQFRKLNLVVLLEKAGDRDAKVYGAFSVVTVEKESRRIPMSSYSFDLVELFSRRRLPKSTD